MIIHKESSQSSSSPSVPAAEGESASAQQQGQPHQPALPVQHGMVPPVHDIITSGLSGIGAGG